MLGSQPLKTPRPRPPKSRSGPSRQSISVSTQEEICNSPSTKLQSPLVSAAKVLSLDVDGDEEVNKLDREWIGGKTREELELMLLNADKVIRERDRDLSLAASIGQSLLEHNLALRQRQEALEAKAAASRNRTHPAHPSRQSRTSLNSDVGSSPISTTPSRPRTLSRTSKTGSVSLNSPTSATMHTFTPTPPDSVHSRSNSIRSVRSVRSKMSISVSSRELVEESFHPAYQAGSPFPDGDGNDSTRSQKTPQSPTSSRMNTFSFPPSPERQNATNNNLIASLSKQNAELSVKLSELEQDAKTVDMSGKKKLRKLERELTALKGELEEALKRNEELEEKGKKKTDMLTKVELDTATTHSGWTPVHLTPNRSRSSSMIDNTENDIPKPLNDGDLDAVNDQLKPISMESSSSQMTITTSSSSAKSIQDLTDQAHEHALVAQLMAKIAELEEANLHIEQEKISMDERLEEAREEMERLRVGYEQAEEEEGMALVEWTGRAGLITWKGAREGKGGKRKGNRGMIEKRRARMAAENAIGQGLMEFPRTAIIPAILSNTSPSPSNSTLSVPPFSSPTRVRHISTDSSFSRDAAFSKEDLDVYMAKRRKRERTRSETGSSPVRIRNLKSELGKDDIFASNSRHVKNATDNFGFGFVPLQGQLETGFSDGWEDLEDGEETDREKLEVMGVGDYFDTKRSSSLESSLATPGSSAFPSITTATRLSRSSASMSKRSAALKRLGFHGEFSSDEEGDGYDYISKIDYDGRRYGARGTDYYPVSMKARFAPKMVKRRVEVASSRYVEWVMTWSKFVLFLIVAVLYAVYQGPNRQLGPQHRVKPRYLNQ